MGASSRPPAGRRASTSWPHDASPLHELPSVLQHRTPLSRRHRPLCRIRLWFPTSGAPTFHEPSSALLRSTGGAVSGQGCRRTLRGVAAPTKSCGTARLPVSSWMTARLFGNSVTWVSVQVASPTTVHSIRTVDSASPQLSASARVYSGVDRTIIFASSVRMSWRRSACCSAGNVRLKPTLSRSPSTPGHWAARPDSRQEFLSTIAFRRGSNRHTV